MRHADAYRVTRAASPRRKLSSDTVPSTGTLTPQSELVALVSPAETDSQLRSHLEQVLNVPKRVLLPTCSLADNHHQAYKQVKSAMALIWKAFQVAEQIFRRLNAPELLPSMDAGYAGM